MWCTHMNEWIHYSNVKYMYLIVNACWLCSPGSWDVSGDSTQSCCSTSAFCLDAVCTVTPVTGSHTNTRSNVIRSTPRPHAASHNTAVCFLSFRLLKIDVSTVPIISDLSQTSLPLLKDFNKLWKPAAACRQMSDINGKSALGSKLSFSCLYFYSQDIQASPANNSRESLYQTN